MLWGYQLCVFVLFQLVDYSALETLRFMRVVGSVVVFRWPVFPGMERRLNDVWRFIVVEFVADFSLAGFLGVRVTAVEYSCSHVM